MVYFGHNPGLSPNEIKVNCNCTELFFSERSVWPCPSSYSLVTMFGFLPRKSCVSITLEAIVLNCHFCKSGGFDFRTAKVSRSLLSQWYDWTGVECAQALNIARIGACDSPCLILFNAGHHYKPVFYYYSGLADTTTKTKSNLWMRSFKI